MGLEKGEIGLSKKIFTVDEVAQILDMHPRTIRRYIKDGNLAAHKLGGQWRIHEEDLIRVMDEPSFREKKDDKSNSNLKSFIDGDHSIDKGKIQICTIIDYYVTSAEEAKSICNSIIDVVNKADKEIKFEYSYDSSSSKARFTLWGHPKMISNVLEVFSKEELS